MKHFTYEAPASIDEVCKILGDENAVLSAAGTDLLGVLKEKLLPSYPDKVVSLKHIPDMSYIREEKDGLHIGAMTTLADIAESDTVRKNWDALAEAAYSVASPNIRNTATVGGNICQDIRCWYYRYPHSIGERINCARKEGHLCSAMMGENRYHSIFGCAKVTDPSCTHSCPAHTDISAYMAKLRAGDVDGAARIIMEANPMPAITSRVCAHFCMEGCNRNQYDEPLNIGSVERYVGDYILDHHQDYMKAPAAENGKKIAIIGSGPAGLTAAFYLRQSGYSVTMYEKQKEAGGCLAYAIPPYRLPKAIVRKFISALEDMGVKIVCNTHIGEDTTLAEIAGIHDGVMLDTGTWKRPLIGLAGEEVTQFGLDFLVGVNNYILNKPGARVVVVGGGNVAMDVAITAKRLGSEDVKMVCLEQRDGMPANAEEIERALEEDVEILNGWGPMEILKEKGSVSGIRFKACTRVLDDTGRFNPLYDEDDILKLNADIILMAIGQLADLAFLEGTYSVETERGRIKATEGNMTSVPGIFAGGDVTTGPATVVAAIAAGKNTAISINSYCGGNDLKVEKTKNSRISREIQDFDTSCRSMTTSRKAELLNTDDRAIDKEDQSGLSEEAVLSEASRCFNCGCLAVNPSDMANMLYAYGARVITTERTIDAPEFFAGHTKITDVLRRNEIVREIVVPRPAEGSVARYDKFRIRKSIDFAVLAVASIYSFKDGIVEDASLVLGAVAPVPMKRLKAEEYLKGKKLSEEVARKAAGIALEDAVPLDKNEYKIDIAKTLICRSLGF